MRIILRFGGFQSDHGPLLRVEGPAKMLQTNSESFKAFPKNVELVSNKKRMVILEAATDLVGFADKDGRVPYINWAGQISE